MAKLKCASPARKGKATGEVAVGVDDNAMVVSMLIQQAERWAIRNRRQALLFDERGYAVLHVVRNEEKHAEEQEPQHKTDQYLFEAPHPWDGAFRLVERQRTHVALLLRDDANRRARVALFLRRMKC